jgi:hypothetical protein
LKKPCSAASDESDNSEVEEEEKGDQIEEHEDEEEEQFFDAEAPTVDIEGKDLHHMDPDLWEFGAMPARPNLNFMGQTGPTHAMGDFAASTPFQFFCLFIPVFYWERWAQYTNCKAELFTSTQSNKKSRYWKATTAAELKAWVASVIWWCLGVSQSMNCFWDDDYERSRMKRWFSKWRWAQIKRFFKVSDPIKDPENKGNKIYKVKEVWDDFIQRCRANYWPAQQVGIDEAIKRFKGRCSFKQYIKSKPVRWGLKVFAVCCSATGYLWNAAIYCGRNDQEDSEKKEMGATHSIALSLLEPLAYKNHIVHMDNFYTSIPLFNALARLLIWACGTVRINRKGLCPQVSIKKSEESKLKKNPGTIRWAAYGTLCYMSWFAKRAVHMLSNCYLPTSNDETSVNHWFTENGNKVQREIPRPHAIQQYNLYMGAVDLYDQYRSYIQMDLRSTKFWHPLFWLIIESALLNSWLLYKVTMEAANLPLTYTFFTFRKSVALALVSEWESKGCRNVAPGTNSPSKTVPNTKNIRMHVKHAVSAVEGDRFTAPDKHLTFMEKIPQLEDSNLKVRQLLCRQCKSSRSIFWCPKCAAALCKDTCYVAWHTYNLS